MRQQAGEGAEEGEREDLKQAPCPALRARSRDRNMVT